MTTLFLSLAAAALLVGVDQLLKWWAAQSLQAGPLALIPGVFSFTYHENYGAAFGILQERRIFLVLFTLLVLGALCWVLVKGKVTDKVLIAALTLIVAGGVGNLIDRIVRGYVVDFLYFELINFPIFNFADCCVCVGTGLVVLYLLVLEPRKKKQEPPSLPEEP